MTVSVDIDQFTLVLQSTVNVTVEDWFDTAVEISREFLEKSHLDFFYPIINFTKDGLPAGYTHGFIVENVPFYLSVAFHEYYKNMGVIVKFSAFSWSDYRKCYEEQFNEPIQLNTFLNMIISTKYHARLSRVDLCCDFINEGISIPKLKRSIEQGRTEIRYGKRITRKSY
ncbi:hypothetical protein ACMZ6Y_02030 [Streptococcus pluranimalium]|uniref:hypothetical protein n=1 Tax=Streptococcus TaxID=1301 RepID=UPI0014781523|nr:hypothetical protein [Streptococcus hyovaginalis]